MKVSDEMHAYKLPPEQRGFYELSAAIVSVAVKDYRQCRKLNSKGAEEIRRFFLSDVFERISMVDNPNLFLKKLDEQIDLEIKAGIRRKREKQTMKCNG